MNQAFYDLIYLCKCAVNGVVPEEQKLFLMDLEQLYTASKYHALTGIAACALESAGIKNNKFCAAKEKVVRKNIFFDIERRKLFLFCENNGIWYMPLKGCVLKEIYPDFSMRQMADNDILFDAKYQADIKKYFEDNGYSVVSYGHGNHDIYEKPPVLNFEMHTALFGKSYNRAWNEYYSNIFKRLIKDSDYDHGYHFTDEDFYIYMMAHEYKHYAGGGTGLRSLVDHYVYLKAKNDSLDWKYISDECEKLGISDFERQSRELAKNIFSESATELSDDDKAMLEFYLGSGAYGTLEQKTHQTIDKLYAESGSDSKRKAKMRYIKERLFPPMEVYKARYPFFYRHKVLLPLGWVCRVVKGVTVSRKRVNKEFIYACKYDDKKKK